MTFNQSWNILLVYVHSQRIINFPYHHEFKCYQDQQHTFHKYVMLTATALAVCKKGTPNTEQYETYWEYAQAGYLFLVRPQMSL